MIKITFKSYCGFPLLKQRNTRYKNPQLVAQHRFVASLIFLDVFRFSPCVVNLPSNKNICCAKSRARVYFERQILVLLLVFHHTHNLSNKFARALPNQPSSAPHFFNPKQMFLLQVKLIAPGEKRETSTKTGLQRNSVARQVEGFCISCFAALTELAISELNCVSL